MFEDSDGFPDFDDDSILQDFDNPKLECIVKPTQKRPMEPETEISSKKLKTFLKESETFLKNPSLESLESKVEIHFNSSMITPPGKIVQRKFPGPAGLLPDRSNTFTSSGESQDESKAEIETILCSQKSVGVFQYGCWEAMVRDMQDNSSANKALDTYNIHYIKSQATLKKLVKQKAPFLAAVIENIEVGNGNPPTINATLKDLTGVLQASIHTNIYENHSEELTIGSVIVLKDFGVLTSSNNNHYLSITPDNLLTIYTTDIGKNDQNSDKVRKIVVQEDCISNIFDSKKENFIESRINDKKKIEDNELKNYEFGSLDDEFDIPEDFKEQASQSCNIVKPSPTNISPLKTQNLNVIKTVPKNDILDGFKEKASQKCNFVEPISVKTKNNGPLVPQELNGFETVVKNNSNSLKSAKSETKSIFETSLDGVDVDSFFDDF